MSEKYPRVVRDKYRGHKNKRCLLGWCKEKVTRTATVETSYFRGEDNPEVYLCDTHGKKYNGKDSIPNPNYVDDDDLLGNKTAVFNHSVLE